MRTPLSMQTLEHTQKLRRLIVTLANWVPWKSLCLDQALTLQSLLKTQRLPTTLIIGVKKDHSWEAHAWLRCADKWVIGYPQIPHHEVGWFAWTPQ